jgi:hypothetical protein
MKLVLGIAALALAGAAGTAAEAQGLPPGPYLRQCRDVHMEGQFLHAWCRGTHGAGTSSINVRSCSTAITVGPDGGLVCGGPGVPGAAPLPPPPPYPPGPRPPPGAGGYDRYSVTIYDRPGFRGRSMRLDGDTPNLDRSRFNDRVASIRLRRRSGPWLACEDANYRGRCVTISSDARDLRAFGMLNRISSMRPLWDERRPGRR